MFIIKNGFLEKLIRTSKVLRSKLNPEELEKFVDKAHLLPKETQKKLIEKLKKEEQILQSAQKRQKLANDFFEKIASEATKELETRIKTDPQADQKIIAEIKKKFKK